MGVGNKNYVITDDSSSPFLVAANRVEVILRNLGPDRVFLAFNEAAEDGLGMYLDMGDAIILSGLKADAALYAVCAYTESSELVAQITL